MGPEATKGPPVFLNRLAYVGFSLLLLLAMTSEVTEVTATADEAGVTGG
jgi:hypothetical protein